MSAAGGVSIRRLGAGDVAAMRGLNALFADVFDDRASYADRPPSDAELADALGRPGTIPLVAEREGTIVGGLVAYEMRKLEQARSEIYIYDLAVLGSHRRQGIATALIEALKPIAKACGAWMIFVQADPGDDPAIALYDKLGLREDVLHFDILPHG